MTTKKIVTSDILAKARAEDKILAPDYANIKAPYPNKVKENLFIQQPTICESVLDLIGSTPMVRLSRLAAKYNLECDLVAKCEFMSGGGSVKDRAAKQMIEAAEEEGILKPNSSIIVEASSGNTGISLALMGCLKGYHVIITLPEKMSQEKLNLLIGLGAEVVRTPTEAAWNNPESNITLARRLCKVLPNAVNLDQYKNPANPMAHYQSTANEIYQQCDGKVDAIVMTSGTGGTLCGTGRRFKEISKNTRIVGVDPIGSILAQPQELNINAGQSYLVEGIGYDFIPSVCDRQYVDEWIKVEDGESLRMAREALQVEGLMIGQSCGAALVGAIKIAKTLKKGQRCVVLLPDSIRNYMTKHLNFDYMVYHGFEPVPSSPSPFGDSTVRSIQVKNTPTILDSVSCLEAVTTMNVFDLDHIPMTDFDMNIIGVISLSSLHKGFLIGQFTKTDMAKRHLVKKYRAITYDTKVTDVGYFLNVCPYCLLFDEERNFVSLITLKNLYCPGVLA